jgi:hypothetical protein
VVGLVLDAIEKECNMVVFLRDQDADEERERAIEDGMNEAKKIYPDAPEIVGRAVKPNLEGWIAALKGKLKTESLKPKQAVDLIKSLGVENTTEAIVSVIENADLEGIPVDANGLRSWMESARTILPRLVSGESL